MATAIGTFADFQPNFTMLTISLSGLIGLEFRAGTTFIVTPIATIVMVTYCKFAITTTETDILKI
jgi:hypothetical protein